METALFLPEVRRLQRTGRRINTFIRCLAECDLTRRKNLDGTGNLSEGSPCEVYAVLP